MPFTPTDTIPTARVTIKFAGLLLLRPNGPNTCEIGIHRLSDIHLFQVILVVNKPGLPPTLIRLITGHLESELTIDSDRTNPGFRAFELGASFDPATANELDHRWALNMRFLHPGVDFNDDATPIAIVNDGVLFTSNLSLPHLKPRLVRDGETRHLPHVAADLAAALDVPLGNTVQLKWTHSGENEVVLLPREHDPTGTTYTLMLLNEPPRKDDTQHDELDLYYHVLELNGEPVDPAERWKLEYEDKSKTDEIPCLPVELNP